MTNHEKLEYFIEISDKTKKLAKLIIDKISRQIETQNRKLTWREKVIFGLARKGFLTFECLEEDARKGRGEAQHHLKTLVECFMYYRWVIQDDSDTNAKLLLAKSCKGKISFFDKNPDYPERTELCTKWEEFFNNLIHGIKENWNEFKKKSLEKLSEDSNVEVIYRRIYKLACEPAHISDILDYFPIPDRQLSLKQPDHSILQSAVAIDYALHIIYCFLHDASDFYKLGLSEIISGIKNDLEKTRNDVSVK